MGHFAPEGGVFVPGAPFGAVPKVMVLAVTVPSDEMEPLTMPMSPCFSAFTRRGGGILCETVDDVTLTVMV